MNCPTCGKEYEDSVTFCGICGTYIADGEIADPPQLPRVGFLTAIKSAYKGYFKFSGRATGAEFWLWALLYYPASVVAYILNSPEIVIVIIALFVLVSFIPNLAVMVRRLHDTGRSAWWIFINLVPFIGWVVLVILLLGDGEEGGNKYGRDPRQGMESVDDLQPDRANIVDCPECGTKLLANGYCSNCQIYRK